MDGGALHHALEPGGGLGVTCAVGRQPSQILVQELGQVLLDLLDIHTAGAQHRHCIGIVHEPEQQMLQRCVFMLAFSRQGERAVQGLF